MKLRCALLISVALTVGVGVGAAVAGTAPGKRGPATRAWKKDLTAPAQFDLTLAEVRFGAPARVGVSRARAPRRVSAISLSLRGPSGLDYVAAAVTRFSVLGRPRALVLVVNRRPRGSLAPDLARIGLTVTAARSLGAPLLRQLSNPFTRPAALEPALCDLPIRGASLTASDLRSVLSRGLPLTGAGPNSAARFSAEAAVAHAYDAVCHRPYDQAFRQAVTQGSTPTCQTGQASIVSCCPANAMCTPPPCAPCPCPPAPCPVPVRPARNAAIACPLQSPPIACPL